MKEVKITPPEGYEINKKMNKNTSKVIKIKNDIIVFDTEHKLYSYHESDCCEWHYLDMEHLTMKDFENLEFDLISGKDFFKRIVGYGIELLPINGHSVKIPGYGYNNGYYSDNLTLHLDSNVYGDKVFDITDCQYIEDN